MTREEERVDDAADPDRRAVRRMVPVPVVSNSGRESGKSKSMSSPSMVSKLSREILHRCLFRPALMVPDNDCLRGETMTVLGVRSLR